MQKNHYHAVIVGAGLAGTCSVLALLKQFTSRGLKLAVLDKQDVLTPQAGNGADSRAIALSKSTYQSLLNWVDHAKLSLISEPILDIEVSEAGSAASSFLNSNKREGPYGYVVTAADLQTLFLQTLSESALSQSITWYSPDELIDYTADEQEVELTLNKSGRISCDYLLACDGSHSQVRQLAQLPVQTEGFDQSALTAIITVSDNPFSGRAYERFCETGPLALLPLKQPDQFALVWCLPPAQLATFKQKSAAAQINSLHTVLGYRAGRIRTIRLGATYPLNSYWMPQAYCQRTLFLANACHTLHPVAGQGFNLAVRDILAACQLLDNSKSVNRLTWRAADVVAYHQRRQQDILVTRQATEFLVRCFSNNYQPLRLLRNIGLCGLQIAPPLKQAMTHFAMGYRTK
ncbi:FAD-dependent monooxygenase [Gayadomonas joobiniege]|uniref:FAD-dependent monooxygenase n=1 Tax=Gayadomonas joobiniege TaxID=1234606 RepID=UPI0003652765|nr:FAD-dependent monooxygenase [Gayadomonas joobiniege]